MKMQVTWTMNKKEKQTRLDNIKADLALKLTAVPEAHQVLVEAMRSYLELQDAIEARSEEATNLMEELEKDECQCECCCPCKKKDCE